MPASGGRIKHTYVKNLHKSSKKANALALPFFDDFSQGKMLPDANLWAFDTLVHIDTYLPFNPPSVGVAVLDAVSIGGQHYNQGSPHGNFIADTLQSNSIDLSNCSTNHKPYLYFHYQPQGLGSIGCAPEKEDSLFVFVSGNGKDWDKAWACNGKTLKEFYLNDLKLDTNNLDTVYFKQIRIDLDSTDYWTETFRFKFVSKASLGSAIENESAEYTNDDFWLIDYVYLDTVQKGLPYDMAFTHLPSPIFKSFYSVPKAHYSEAIKKDRGYLTYETFNQSPDEEQWGLMTYFTAQNGEAFDSLYFKDTEAKSNELFFDRLPLEMDNLKFVNNYIEENNSFNITHRMNGDASDFSGNNTVTYTQEISDYYAYDDGTAEAAYDMSTVDIRGTMVAMRFHSYIKDTLSAIRINFQRNNPQDDALGPFTLYIWAADENNIGDTLLVQPGCRPDWGVYMNDFTEIALERGIEIEGDFYIGWLNVSGSRMNIGFDRNNDNMKKVSFYKENEWYNSNLPGTLMIRPVFASPTKKKTTITDVDEWACYPNPVKGNVINLDGELFEYNQGRVKIMNHMGTLYYQGDFKHTSIQVSDFPNGVYFITCIPNVGIPSSKTIIIQ
jgi:hypothetical protein